MEPVEFKIDNHTITYSLNWLGIETILLNGNKISNKLSLGKRVHSFKLMVNGVLQSFHIESKQSFSTSTVKVQLFQNGELIDSANVEFFTSKEDKGTLPSNKDNSMFAVGVMFIVLSMCFDISKFFLFMGLIFIFTSISGNKSEENTSEENNYLEQPKE